jgi:predicted HD superfamily hydrolase involved in NAD metabolism
MREQVISWLSENVSEHRLQHILGVEQMCIELANHHNCDPELAARAGLMHDLAKFFPPTLMLQMAREHDLELDSITLGHPHLLHAEVSALVAQREFGVKNPELLTAIANHTLGRPAMSQLSCIVFVADKLEPNRGNSPELEIMRQTSYQDLYRSVRQTCDYSLKYLLDSHSPIHPRTILTRNWALQITSKAN